VLPSRSSPRETVEELAKRVEEAPSLGARRDMKITTRGDMRIEVSLAASCGTRAIQRSRNGSRSRAYLQRSSCACANRTSEERSRPAAGSPRRDPRDHRGRSSGRGRKAQGRMRQSGRACGISTVHAGDVEPRGTDRVLVDSVQDVEERRKHARVGVRRSIHHNRRPVHRRSRPPSAFLPTSSGTVSIHGGRLRTWSRRWEMLLHGCRPLEVVFRAPDEFDTFGEGCVRPGTGSTSACSEHRDHEQSGFS